MVCLRCGFSCAQSVVRREQNIYHMSHNEMVFRLQYKKLFSNLPLINNFLLLELCPLE